MRWWVTFGVLGGCGGGDDLLAKLDGPYEGTFDADGTELPIVAEFEFRKDEGILFGQLLVTLPGEEPSVWAVRRSEVIDDEVFLDLTDTADIERGMDLDGSVGGPFEGDATVTFPCPAGVCGFSGPFVLKPGGEGVTTTDLPGA